MGALLTHPGMYTEISLGYILVWVLRRKRTNKIYIFTIKNWLLWLQRLRNPRPAVGKLETQESQLQVKVKEQEKTYIPSWRRSGRERANSPFVSLLFYSGLQWVGWGSTTLREQSVCLFDLWIPMLIFSRNTFPDIEIMYKQTSGTQWPSQIDTKLTIIIYNSFYLFTCLSTH